MPPIVAEIADTVRERLRAERADPDGAARRARELASLEVRRHNDYALARGLAPIDDENGVVDDVLARVAGYGALQRFIEDPEVEEIWINSPEHVFLARGGRSERVPLALSESEVRELVERMLHATGRRVDLSQPFVDASLPVGRLHVVIPDVTRRFWSVNLRKYVPHVRTLEDLLRVGALDAESHAILRRAMGERRTVLVSGATHAGKTTTLAALLSAGPAEDRIVTVEETFELSIEAEDVVAMQGRQPSLEGTGEITLRRLVREALRMRPERLVVGEVRDAEALDLLLALNTGIPGAATIHANSARDALVKLAALPLLAGRNIDLDFVVPAIARSVDLVVHCRRTVDGARRVAEIVAPTGRVIDGACEVEQLYEVGA